MTDRAHSIEIASVTLDRLEEGYELAETYLLGVARVPAEIKERLAAKVREIREILDSLYEPAT